MKRHNGWALAALAMLAATALFAQQPNETTTTIAWDPSPAAEAVTSYTVAYRQKGSTGAWTEVAVASPNTQAVVPAGPFATEFRARAVNAFGPGPWTATAVLPAGIKLRFVLDVTP